MADNGASSVGHEYSWGPEAGYLYCLLKIENLSLELELVDWILMTPEYSPQSGSQ